MGLKPDYGEYEYHADRRVGDVGLGTDGDEGEQGAGHEHQGERYRQEDTPCPPGRGRLSP